MKRTELPQEIRKMQFEEAYGGWEAGRSTTLLPSTLSGLFCQVFG